jgi:hypothetical protein
MGMAKPAADLLGQLGGDLLAQKAANLLGFDRKHHLARELLAEGLTVSVASERKIRWVEYSSCITLQ